MNGDARASLVAAVTRLSRALRERELLASPAETVDALRALEQVDIGDRQDVYFALRSVLVSRVEDQAIFDALFATLEYDAGDPSPNERDHPPNATLPRPAVAATPALSRNTP